MTNRPPAFHHADDTRSSRDQHEQIDKALPVIDPGMMRTMLPSPYQPQQVGLPLVGFYRLYEAQLRAERKSPNTLRIYGDALGKFKKWLEETYETPATLGDFTSTNVRLFLGDAAERAKWEGHPTLEGITREKLSGSTIHQYVRGLKTFGAWLERERYAAVHPLYSVRPPRVDQKQLRPLSEAEERALLDAYDDNSPTECRLKAIFLLLLDTGMRLSELTGLKAENVDLDHGFLLVMGKGRKERSIPFGFTTERVLRKYVSFSRATPALPSVDEFFLSPDGYPLTYNAVKMIFTRAAKRSGIERLHPHLLRHTYGIRAQESGMPTITLQHYMGHSSSKVTERYAHAAQSERLKRARGYSPIDLLRLRVSRPRPGPRSRRLLK